MPSSKPKLKTPRPYLSWSQLALWEKSPYEYAKAYIYSDERIATNAAMDLGRELAEALARNDWKKKEAPDIELARILLPSCRHTEYEVPRLKGDGCGSKEIPCTECAARGIERPLFVRGISIYGKFDGFDDKKNLVITEHKTGRSKWTQKRVDTLGQLSFYSLLVYLKFGKLPDEIRLNWVPAQYDDEGELKLIGDIQTFETRRTMADLLAISVRIERAWEGIKELCAGEYPAIGL